MNILIIPQNIGRFFLLMLCMMTIVVGIYAAIEFSEDFQICKVTTDMTWQDLEAEFGMPADVIAQYNHKTIDMPFKEGMCIKIPNSYKIIAEEKAPVLQDTTDDTDKQNITVTVEKNQIVDGYGDSNGTVSGDVPLAFNDGKINDKFYFIRVRHTGNWNSYSNGMNNLLQFMNNSGLSAANSETPMSLKDIDANYLNKGGVPSFLYFYCDTNFSLTADEVEILKKYIDKGGFLFIDSRPDSNVETVVRNQMEKVFSPSTLSEIANGHEINTYQYKLVLPGTGLNIAREAANYGIQKDGRYVVFYTKGHFVQLYSAISPNTQEKYFQAQYQMGVNVVMYAINKGRTGADVRIDEAAKNTITDFH